MTAIRLDDSEYRVLEAMRACSVNGRVRQQDVVRAVHLARGTIPAVVSRLIDKGAVQRIYPGNFRFTTDDCVPRRVRAPERSRLMGAR